MSTATARRVDGGYRFDGHKMFGSNGPVWGYLGVHALDASDPEQTGHRARLRTTRRPRRDGPCETWDTLGMRPSQSHDTTARIGVRARRAGRPDHTGRFRRGPVPRLMNIWALSLFSSVYLGIAERALELAVTSATTKRSVAIPQGTYAHNPMVQHQIAEMFLELQAGRSTLDRLIDDFVCGVDHGAMWGAHIVGEVAGGRVGQARGRHRPRRRRAAPACSAATSSSGCTETSGAAASTRRTTR
jgi:alkylation response protein AidB-like acyl-CoA dehydrogenase